MRVPVLITKDCELVSAPLCVIYNENALEDKQVCTRCSRLISFLRIKVPRPHRGFVLEPNWGTASLRDFVQLLISVENALVFTERRYALHGICYRNSVCPSVRPSVTLVDCVHRVRPTITISSPQGSPIILVSSDITFIPKFRGSPQARALNEGGVGTDW